MDRRVRALALLSAFSLAGCGKDPKTVVVTEANKDRLLEDMQDMRGLTVGESRMLIAHLMRSSMGKSLGQNPASIVGKTVAQIIDEQRAFELDSKKQQAEQARLAAEAKAKEQLVANELRKTINLTVYEKAFQTVEYQDYITIYVAYENRSPKDVRAFTGSVKFDDLFDKPIYRINLTVSDPVTAGAKSTWNGTVRFNKFDAEQVAFRNAELKDTKVTWLPSSVLFADGQRIGSVPGDSE